MVVPIRLAQQHTTSGKWSGVLGGQAEQGLERRHGGAASVEAEHELVDIVGQMFDANAVMGAQQPGLQVGEGAMDPRQLLGGILRIADHGWPVVVASAQGPEGMPAIGQDHSTRRDRFLGEAGERGGREVGHDRKPDPAGAVAADLHGTGPDRLLAVALPAAAPPFLHSTDIGLVQLHRA